MDFFESQERARKLTRRLVLLYLLAVVLIVTTVYVVAAIIFLDPAARVGDNIIQRFWNAELYLTVAIITLIVIISGTLFRVFQLRGGGASVAEMMGGRKINHATKDPNERRLVNVVEEMSIASGIAVPDIFVMDREDSINAFAAGYSMNDAAVAVTRGTLTQLNRDELQGVIAHEFSHIFNGDMRLNIRLIGILNGILLLHLIGFILLRGGIYGSMGRGRGRSNDKGGGAAAILALAIGLIIIGYIGTIFGRIIQSAVSRQREYLADAAAVQYTRNPEGISGALKKIRDAHKGAQINDAHAMELSHMFFASGFRSALDSLFATHPPIDKRLQAIDFYYKSSTAASQSESSSGASVTSRADSPGTSDKVSSNEGHSFYKGSVGGNDAFIRPEILIGAIGVLGGENTSRAATLMREIPEELIDAAHDPMEAEALIYYLLMSNVADIKSKQLEYLESKVEKAINKKVNEILKNNYVFKPEWNLPLVDLAIPALRNLSIDQYKDFKSNVKELIDADQEVSLFEFVLEKVLFKHLDVHHHKYQEPKVKFHNLKPLATELSILLSALAHAGGKDSRKAFKSAVHTIERVSPVLTLIEKDSLSYIKIDKSLNRLAESAAPVKKYFIHAAVACIVVDNQVSLDELELLRAMADTMDIPLPPL